ELLVGVEDLLVAPLEDPAATSEAGSAARSGADATTTGAPQAAAASGSSSEGTPLRTQQGRVLVLSTTSRPTALDSLLVGCLGRNEKLLVASPDADQREAFLVGRLIAEGAALGVEQVDRLVRYGSRGGIG
ncbi:hypothetical protein Agub_g15878, partial [Astrephomene gubernaculifera]